jgi:hypothetical protein
MEDIYVKVKGRTFEKLFNEDLVSMEDVFATLEELMFDKERLEEEFEDYKQEVKEFYEPRTDVEYYDM